MPDWIVELLVARPRPRRRPRAVLDAGNEPRAVTLRVNPARATRDAVEAELRDDRASRRHAGASCPTRSSSRGAGDLGALPAVRDGRATPRTRRARRSRRSSVARPGERVLEIGAAPGGKATALAEAMGDAGLVVGLDVHPGRTRMIAHRRGAGSGCDRGRRRSRPTVRSSRSRRRAFDRVLLDAPCSGLGVLRRRPEARWRLGPAQLAELATLQRGSAARRRRRVVRPGGRLVYSVCTLSAAETTGIDEWAATHLAELRRRAAAGRRRGVRGRARRPPAPAASPTPTACTA